MNRGVLAAIVVGAGLAGGAAYVLLGRSTAPAVPALTQSTPPPSPSPDDAAPAKLVATLPDFQLADRDGKMRSLQDWQGKSLIVNFWATWCAPCRREIPLLQRIEQERGGEGFQVVGIAVDFRDKVLEYANEMKIGYPLLIGEQDGLDAASAFGVEAVGFPFTVFSDAQGRVIMAHLGELHEPQAKIILDQIARVNAGEQTPEQARSAIATGLSAMPAPSDGKSGG